MKKDGCVYEGRERCSESKDREVMGLKIDRLKSEGKRRKKTSLRKRKASQGRLERHPTDHLSHYDLSL